MSQQTSSKPSNSPSSGMTSRALESHLGFWMRFVSNHVSGEFRKLVESNGVSVSEWVALRQLYDDKLSTAATLLETLGMTKGAISKILGKLEEKGLAQRTWLDTDKRAQKISLTAAGKRLVPRLTRLADQNDERFFGHIPVGQRIELARVLKEIVQKNNLTNIPID